MQARLLARSERAPNRVAQDERPGAEVLFLDKKHLLYKRMDRWVRLQQFVYGLPDDFSYSVQVTESGGLYLCRTLVRVGWMSWYGVGRATDRQQALALALLETSDAISANAYKLFFYSASKRILGWWRNLKGKVVRQQPAAEFPDEELLAG